MICYTMWKKVLFFNLKRFIARWFSKILSLFSKTDASPALTCLTLIYFCDKDKTAPTLAIASDAEKNKFNTQSFIHEIYTKS